MRLKALTVISLVLATAGCQVAPNSEMVANGSTVQNQKVTEVGEDYFFGNSEGCRVNLTRIKERIWISAAKHVNGKTKKAQLLLGQNLDNAEITTYCSKFNQENTKVSVSDDTLTASCLNGRAKFVIQWKDKLRIQSIDFSGFHYNFLNKVDDSFSCRNLQEID